MKTRSMKRKRGRPSQGPSPPGPPDAPPPAKRPKREANGELSAFLEARKGVEAAYEKLKCASELQLKDIKARMKAEQAKVQSERNKFSEEKEEATQALAELRETISREKQSWEAAKQKMAELQPFGRRVNLDVGGIRYSTTLSTLTKHEGTFLATMFSGRFKNEPDEAGYYFIDRDGGSFRYILGFLRDGGLAARPSEPEAIANVRREARYYGLHELMLDQGYFASPSVDMELVKVVGCSSLGLDDEGSSCSMHSVLMGHPKPVIDLDDLDNEDDNSEEDGYDTSNEDTTGNKYWRSEGGANEWLLFDLGRISRFDTITTRCSPPDDDPEERSYYPKTIKVYTKKARAEPWDLVCSYMRYKSDPKGAHIHELDADVTARFVKLKFVDRHDDPENMDSFDCFMIDAVEFE